MASYEIRMTHSAEKELADLSKSLVGVIWPRIVTLAERPKSAQTRKLRGADQSYRLRVRRYRIVYTVDENHKLVTITAIRRRKDSYP